MLLLQPKYYDRDYNKMLKILIGCKETGCTFLVGGRSVDGAFKVVLHKKGAIIILVFLFLKFNRSEAIVWCSTGSWRFGCSRGTKGYVHLHSR